jgi:hypothetical protein
VVLAGSPLGTAAIERAKLAGSPLGTAAIAAALRSNRARLGWVNRRIRESERLAGALIQWRELRRLHAAVGDFTRAA